MAKLVLMLSLRSAVAALIVLSAAATAVRARTGKRVWSRLVGVGALFDNYYSPITLGPDGTVYVGTFGGLVAIRGPLTR
jgi:outer membrane protein assembly factor BamB